MVGSISLLLLVKYRFHSEIITAIFLPKQINFTILKLKKQNLIWCPFAEQEKWLLQYIGFVIQDDDTSNKCFDDDILVIGLIADFAVLFTFGVAFPPLAVIVCVSILYQVVFHQVLIGRLLCELEESIIDEEEELAEKSRSLRYTEVLTDKWMIPEIYMGYLADECNSLWAHFKASIKYLAFFSSTFLSFFFFDILGDDLGLHQSIWIIPVTICIPFYIMLGQQFFEYLSSSWKCQGQKPASTQVVPQCIEDDLSSDHNVFRVQDESQVDDQITKEFEH
jgi:hypothetical protein